MKRLYILPLVFLFTFSSNLFAGNADLFSYDEDAVSSELADLTELENYVWTNPAATLSSLTEEGNSLLDGLKLFSPFAMGMELEPPLGIPSFLWGCVFGVVGVALVYFIAEDSDETKKAFFGCLVGAVVYGLVYAVLWAPWAWVGI